MPPFDHAARTISRLPQVGSACASADWTDGVVLVACDGVGSWGRGVEASRAGARLLPGERQKRAATWSEKQPEGRWRSYSYDELVARDKVSLDLFWLRDESLEDSANLPDPHILAAEIAEDLRSALGQIEEILGDLQARANK